MLNDINGYTRTCGLIGNPVEHTLSPVIHNTLSMVLGKNLAYVPFHVETGRLEDAVKGAFALNLLGINVTVPYKSDVIPYLDDIDPLASNIGAVNTLVRTEKGYKGYNTDMPGLYRAMCEDLIFLQQSLKTVLHDYAEIFKKRFSEGLSIRKTADALQMNRGAVERRQSVLYLAFAVLLRQALAGYRRKPTKITWTQLNSSSFPEAPVMQTDASFLLFSCQV